MSARSHMLKVRLSDEELRRLDKVAKRLGLSRSSLLRMLVSVAARERL